MSATPSDLVAIARLNGDFQRNDGKQIGALLYLRSVAAARGRSFLWSSLLFVVMSARATRGIIVSPCWLKMRPLH
jgi:hypothetical protein